jgi:hypothetical protein
MSTSSGTPAKDDIARVAHAIWEAEGRPEGRDHEHWMRAKQLIEEGRAEAEFPEATAPVEGDRRAPRPVQPGFADSAPGIVPHMKTDPAPELREEPGGRFAKQIADLPESSPASEHGDTPGPRNPAPFPPTNEEGYVTVPNIEDATGGALSDDPQPPSPADAGKRKRR